MSVNNYLTYGGPALAPTRNPFNYAKFEQINRDNATPWLTLDEITQQLNLFNDESQDSYLSGLEVATRQAIEDLIGLPIMPISYRVYYNASSLYGVPLSSLNVFMTSPVVCEYTVEASPLAAYPVIKQAGLLLLTHLYNNRSNSTEGMLRDIPFGVTALLRPYKPLVM